MPRIAAILGLVAALTLTPLAVHAQTTGAGTPQIQFDDARKIASDNGIASITKNQRDDGKWEVKGPDAAGRRHEIEIDARNGKIVKMEKR